MVKEMQGRIVGGSVISKKGLVIGVEQDYVANEVQLAMAVMEHLGMEASTYALRHQKVC